MYSYVLNQVVSNCIWDLASSDSYEYSIKNILSPRIGNIPVVENQVMICYNAKKLLQYLGFISKSKSCGFLL